jgi:hypothetical protein
MHLLWGDSGDALCGAIGPHEIDVGWPEGQSFCSERIQVNSLFDVPTRTRMLVVWNSESAQERTVRCLWCLCLFEDSSLLRINSEWCNQYTNERVFVVGHIDWGVILHYPDREEGPAPIDRLSMQEFWSTYRAPPVRLRSLARFQTDDGSEQRPEPDETSPEPEERPPLVRLQNPGRVEELALTRWDGITVRPTRDVSILTLALHNLLAGDQDTETAREQKELLRQVLRGEAAVSPTMDGDPPSLGYIVRTLDQTPENPRPFWQRLDDD